MNILIRILTYATGAAVAALLHVLLRGYAKGENKFVRMHALKAFFFWFMLHLTFNETGPWIIELLGLPDKHANQYLIFYGLLTVLSVEGLEYLSMQLAALLQMVRCLLFTKREESAKTSAVKIRTNKVITPKTKN